MKLIPLSATILLREISVASITSVFLHRKLKYFPIYCCHCPIMEMLAIEATGKMGAAHIVSEPKEFGECHFAIYKDPKDIPDEYYKRIGKTKPK
jgi:hypothetical protein